MRGAAIGLAICAALGFIRSKAAPIDGKELFEKVWTPREGLGPKFNAASCAECHVLVNSAVKPPAQSPLVWVTASLTDPTGGHLFRRFALRADGSARPVAPPSGSSHRRAPSLAGLGLLERAVLTSDGVSSGATGQGRFGWKARYPTIEAVVAGALAGEMGLTSRMFPHGDAAPSGPDATAPEVSSEQLRALVAFVTSLPPPESGPRTDTVRRGESTFHELACDQCHVPSLKLSPVAGGSAGSAHAYTDLLVHDMGPDLADGIAEGAASGREFRTAPLWGVRSHRAAYLHDGRATTLEQAIVAHDGEAQTSAARFSALSRSERQLLVQFLGSL